MRQFTVEASGFGGGHSSPAAAYYGATSTQMEIIGAPGFYSPFAYHYAPAPVALIPCCYGFGYPIVWSAPFPFPFTPVF